MDYSTNRSVTSFLLSHIGLLSLVVGYCIMGAFIFQVVMMMIMMMMMIVMMMIFQELERANEIETKREMKGKRLAMTDTLWDITK